MLGEVRFLLVFAGGRVFGVALFWTNLAPCSSLTLTIFGRDEALLRGVLVGGGLEWVSSG